MIQPIACILAGGRSSRFGADKARVSVGGGVQILRVARAIEPFASEVIVAAETDGKYADLGLKTVADTRPHQGPAGGLRTALEYAGPDRSVLLLSCDFLDIRPHWIQQLINGAERWFPVSSAVNATASTPRAVAFRHSHWEPLMAIYHSSALPRLALISAGADGNSAAASGFAGPLWRILERLEAVALPLPIDWPARVQFNSPAELQANV